MRSTFSERACHAVEFAPATLPVHGNQRTPAGLECLLDIKPIVYRAADNQRCGIIRVNRD
jgi:hypothetical protein